MFVTPIQDEHGERRILIEMNNEERVSYIHQGDLHHKKVRLYHTILCLREEFTNSNKL